MDEWMLNDLLECSVCLERLDTSSKVLPCQHTFCKKCLEDIFTTNKELRCPECRVLFDAKIDDLPPNVLLMRILEGMRNAASKKTNSTGDSVRLGSHIPTSSSVMHSVQPSSLPPINHVAPESTARLLSQTAAAIKPQTQSQPQSQPMVGLDSSIFTTLTSPSSSSSATSSSSRAPSCLTSPSPPITATPDKWQSFNVLHHSHNRCSDELLNLTKVTQEQQLQSNGEVDWVEGPPTQGSPHSALQLPALYIAHHSYKPQKANQLELKYGSVCTVTKQYQNGWFKGTDSHSHSHKSGFFPSSHVILPKRSADKRSPTEVIQEQQLQSNGEGPPTQGSPHSALQLPALYIAQHSYKPQNANHLELKRGSVYTVTEQCQDGWFKGTASRSHKSGLFPSNYVTPAKSLSAQQAQDWRFQMFSQKNNTPAPAPLQRWPRSYTHQSSSPAPTPGSPRQQNTLVENSKEISMQLGSVWENLYGDSKETALWKANEERKRKYPEYYSSLEEARLRNGFKQSFQEAAGSSEMDAPHLAKVYKTSAEKNNVNPKSAAFLQHFLPNQDFPEKM